MTDNIQQFFDFSLHLNQYLAAFVADYRHWTYLLLFVIFFCETGLVITPFLPGDSLIFAAGTISALEGNPLNVFTLAGVIMLGTFTGDNSNYFIGKYFGKKIILGNFKLIQKKHIDKTHAFYDKYGGLTLVLARFMPVIRTFAPFVAGLSQMHYTRFIIFSVAGNVFWVNLYSFTGHYFGNVPFVKHNFTWIMFAIVSTTFIPVIYYLFKLLIGKIREVFPERKKFG